MLMRIPAEHGLYLEWPAKTLHDANTSDYFQQPPVKRVRVLAVHAAQRQQTSTRPKFFNAS